MRRALFLDRDGVLNELVQPASGVYRAPWNWNEVKFYPGLEILQSVRERGYLLVMVTNQPDIERGLVSTAFVDELNRYLSDKYRFDSTYVCPFQSSDHPDKKPNPGLLLRAAREFSLDMKGCWFLGDTSNDVVAAARAGCRSVLIERSYNRQEGSDRRVRSYDELFSVLEEPLG
ncbi:MAG: HAD-IIIA family hydrolase [Deltaproteobacteria bacterium]|nr:HAD-IIIA family hydrolase [Deltaproteobacteria bacterium]MBI3293569.1 HAD-IIIA family hydrolase [Deltaproteobacteria bacterium]